MPRSTGITSSLKGKLDLDGRVEMVTDMGAENCTGIRLVLVGHAPPIAPEAARLLTETGGYVESADTQSGALQAVSSGRFDVVIVNLDNPLIDPNKLATCASATESPGSPIRLVGLMAHDLRPSPDSRFSAIWISQDLDRKLYRIVRSFGFSYESALTNAGEDAELLRELVAIFLEECPKILSDLRHGVASKDAHKVESAAHKLKGSVANFGAPGAVRLAFELEEAARRRDLPAIPEAVVRLELVLLQLCRNLRMLLS